MTPWRAPEGEYYYMIKSDLQVMRMVDSRFRSDDTRYALGNYFETEQDALKAADGIRAYLKRVRMRKGAAGIGMAKKGQAGSTSLSNPHKHNQTKEQE